MESRLTDFRPQGGRELWTPAAGDYHRGTKPLDPTREEGGCTIGGSGERRRDSFKPASIPVCYRIFPCWHPKQKRENSEMKLPCAVSSMSLFDQSNRGVDTRVVNAVQCRGGLTTSVETSRTRRLSPMSCMMIVREGEVRISCRPGQTTCAAAMTARSNE
jgi:hypothetical protein